MAKGEGSHSEMATARQSDGISVIFDHKSPASSRSRSRSRSSGGSSGRHRVRSSHKTRHRSSSSSSVSSSSSCKLSSRPRSRSHPRCHRRSSRCRCDSHRRNGRHRGSPPRQIRADSRSYKQSSSQDRYSSRRNYRSHSRSTSHRHRNRKTEGQVGNKISRSPGRSHKSHSRSSGHSVSQTMDDKRELSAEKTNAMKILRVEKVDLPEIVKPELSEQLVESEESSESETWVRQDPEKTVSQSSDEEPDDISNPKMSPLRKSISFSINNSVAKPTAAALSSAKVTPRVDSYESRKPYGHWIPVRSGKSSKASKHKLTKSH